MSEIDSLSAREKGDCFWRKFRRYVYSAESKGGLRGNIFNVDTALDVLRYLEEKEKPGVTSLSGNEFADRPPSAAGKRAFIRSVAGMMQVSAQIKTLKSAGAHDELNEDALYIEGIKKVGGLIDRLVETFFTACGTDLKGVPFKNRALKKQAEEDFFEIRAEYEHLIKEVNRQGVQSFIARIVRDREQHAYTGGDIRKDPKCEELIIRAPIAYALRKTDTDVILERIRLADFQAGKLKTERDMVISCAKELFYERPEQEWKNRMLIRAISDYTVEVNERLRDILYAKEAGYYRLRWILLWEPVDKIIAEKIFKEYGEWPGIIDGSKRLSDISGFVEPVEKADVHVNGDEEIFRTGEELKEYLYTHPSQFDAQSLLSLATDTYELTDVLSKAYGLMQALDKLTSEKAFFMRPQDEREHIFEIWVMSEVMNRVGYMALEFIYEWQYNTVEETTEALRRILPYISYSGQEKIVREVLRDIVMERSNSFVQQ